jgi:hypothetical protein
VTPLEIRAAMRLGIRVYYRGIQKVVLTDNGHYLLESWTDPVPDYLFNRKGEFRRLLGFIPLYHENEFGTEFLPLWKNPHADHCYP